MELYMYWRASDFRSLPCGTIFDIDSRTAEYLMFIRQNVEEQLES